MQVFMDWRSIDRGCPVRSQFGAAAPSGIAAPEGFRVGLVPVVPLYLEFFHFIQGWLRIEAPLNAARTARSALSLPNPNGIRPHSPELPTRAEGVALAANGLKKSRPLGSGPFKRQREQGRLTFLG